MSITFRQVAFSEDDTTNTDLHNTPETFTTTDDIAAGEWVLFTFFADPGVVTDGGVEGWTEPRVGPDLWCAPYFISAIDPGHGPGISSEALTAQDYGQAYNTVFFGGSLLMLALSDVPSGTTVLASWIFTVPGDVVITCGPRIYAAYVITPTPDFQNAGVGGNGGQNAQQAGPPMPNAQDTSTAPSDVSTLANTDDWVLFWGTDQIVFLSLLGWEDDTITLTPTGDTVVVDTLASTDVAHGAAILVSQETAVNGDFYTLEGTLSGSTFWSMCLASFPLSGLPPVSAVVISQARFRAEDGATGPSGTPIQIRRTRFRVD